MNFGAGRGGGDSPFCVIILCVKMNIRISTKEDLPGIVQIEKKSFSVPWGKEIFEEKLNSLLVALMQENLIAYLLFEKVSDEVHIIRVATHPEYRRQGVANALISSLLNSSKNEGASSAYLEVRESNAPSIRFYESLGFEAAGKRKSYYSEPDEDALLMSKKL